TWRPLRPCLERFRASLSERKGLAGHLHGPQEAAAHEPVDSMGELARRQTHEIRVVEKIRQRQRAARMGHLELLKQHEGGPFRTVEPGLGHAAPPHQAEEPALAYPGEARKPLFASNVRASCSQGPTVRYGFPCPVRVRSG